MTEPDQILSDALERASRDINKPIVTNDEIRSKIEQVCREPRNRACARFLMACALARIHQSTADPRKPYTEIGSEDAFSGRSYDEKYISRLIYENHLPLNPTTAFLTPAFRNLNKPLTVDVKLNGEPPHTYEMTLQLLDEIYQGRVSAEDLLTEVLRFLVLIREERKKRIEILLDGLKSENKLTLSSEEIVSLIEQHLKCKNSSRLPVLIVAAAYQSVKDKLKEEVLPLASHQAADKQTRSFGDVEICLENEDQVVTVYEMKRKCVTIDDIDSACVKISPASRKINNYIFITTETIEDDVRLYALSCYERTEGTEIAILDCIGFLRHFLHIFHRSRARFLDTYQNLVLSEPESAVSQALKEAFLALRQAAEDRGSED
ncbi:restriction endonuclease, SacI family [Chloracidobacterium thermophilum]|nr:restriction endonuclease, SacI family [Chloracidobacterium thermophilum]QUV79147.1 restriction endonuclease, SacI family [Chloracidobacterium thermophilum]